jgi:tetratricopeptide (TPR) repeat protein
MAAVALFGSLAADAQSVAASNARPQEAASLEQLRQTRDALSVVTEYKAALHPAEQIVAKLEDRGDADISLDLLRLASIQADLKDYDAAEMSYLRAIERLEDQKGQYSPALIGPYHALGRMYNEARRFDEALVALEHARWISRRSHGLFNTEQSEMIDDMTAAYVETGNMEEADRLQTERLENAVRRFGPDAPELVEFYEHLGDYYVRTGSLSYGRGQLKKALEISSARFGDASPDSLRVLRRLTALQLRFGRGSDARDRLLAAVEKATDVGPKERGLCWAVLGDWALVDGDLPAANRYYLDAYYALEKSGEVDGDDFFAAPVMLDFAAPLDFYAPQGRAQWSWGEMELAFDVSSSGQPSGVRMVSVEPSDEDRIVSDYTGRILATHFRPALEEGRPVASLDVSRTYKFRYYDRD